MQYKSPRYAAVFAASLIITDPLMAADCDMSQSIIQRMPISRICRLPYELTSQNQPCFLSFLSTQILELPGFSG